MNAKHMMTWTEIKVQVLSLQVWMIVEGLWHFLVSWDATGYSGMEAVVIGWLHALSQDKLLSALQQYEDTGKENPFHNPLSL